MTRTFADPKSLYGLVTVSSPALSEEEGKLYMVRTILSEELDDYQSDLVAFDLKSRAFETVLSDGYKNTNLAIKGQRLLYLSNRTGSRQAYVLDLKTGEKTQITQAPHGILNASWAPQEDTLVFTANFDKDVGDEVAWGAVNKENQGRTYIIANNLRYLADGEGFVDPSLQTYVGIQTLDSSKARLLKCPTTRMNGQPLGHAMTEEKIYYTVAEDAADDYNFNRYLVEYDLATDTYRPLLRDFEKGALREASISPDGRYLAFAGDMKVGDNGAASDLFLYDLEEEVLVNLSDANGLDLQFSDETFSDYFQAQNNPLIQWERSSQYFYSRYSSEGRVSLMRFSVTGQVDRVEESSHVLAEYVLDASSQVYGIESAPSDPYRLTHFDGERWETVYSSRENDYADYAFAHYEDIEFESFDGQRIHGFLVYPTDYDGESSYPLILNIHGGPYAMHANVFYHEAQQQAAQGYAVLLLNPRGSYGYGFDHMRLVYGNFVKDDMQDFLLGVDHALETHSWIDEDRLYCVGGSYGGLSTNRLISLTQRFKAAVTQRCLSNLVSFLGTSDIGYFFSEDEVGEDFMDFEKLWDSSPLKYVDDIETPLLILHSLEDYRCPVEQAQQMYAALKMRGVETEMVLFPDSDHGLSRTGIPSYRCARLDHMISWLNDHP